ncbi:cupredoxin domain-containing protein [Paenibacillus eucommiae]|uniref:Heme/copper-type cytochrome/quinol oxidase subunit 2 n=1 Tax=Paenibacillus eucommiae TaxID=1355755 RepID=A0ABS4ITK0_9BACL|nr:cupredoxin domain-containing protein [Paenibacillus eucommiae]MBP1990900.1 heme/copper-type cytochrome/quinol oxidase subunit 2 [Paenibacillus eucommiae]
MSRVFIIQRKHIILTSLAIVIIAAAVFYLSRDNALPTMAESSSGRTIHMVTGEFSTKTADGKEIEAYRWDPGTIFVQKGEKINLSIYGVNGDSHPFIIEGLNLKGEVKKGKETIVSFVANKKGVFRIICLTHPDIAHSGPMIGYLVVN